MCRLFAVRATEPFPVKAAFHTLSAQSHEHKDGWGLAQYDSGEPLLERDVTAAHASNRFTELSATLRSANLLVHLRLASVGEVVERNSHPFRHDRWTFAHNGTVKKFQSAPGLVEERIAPELRPLIRGETDSERCFYLFLTHLKGGTEAADVTRALRQTLLDVAQLYDAPDKDRPSLNFMVTDGRITAVTRRGRTLFHAEKPGLHLIASERLDASLEWVEIGEDTGLVIDERLKAQRFRIVESA